MNEIETCRHLLDTSPVERVQRKLRNDEMPLLAAVGVMHCMMARALIEKSKRLAFLRSRLPYHTPDCFTHV